MTLFLRNEDNRTILEAEYWVKTDDGRKFLDISAAIDVQNYSTSLLRKVSSNDYEEFITDIDGLSNVRGWLWEVYEDTKPENYNDVLEKLRTWFKEIATKHNLQYVED